MRLLAVLSHYPFPPHIGSDVVAYNNIRELTKEHSVYLLCLGCYREPDAFGKLIQNVEFVDPKSTSRLLQVLRIIFYMGIGVPLLVSGYMSRALHKRACELCEHENFDAILLFDINAIQYCPLSIYKKIIVNIEDPQSIKFLRMIKLPICSLWEKFKLIIHRVLTTPYEKKYLPKMAKVVMLSKADVLDLQTQYGYSNLGFVPYGVDQRPSEAIVGCELRTEGMIVFSGSMFHLPNVDGALFFLQDVFPLVLREYPETRLWIVGADPDSRIREFAIRFGDHVVITGRVNEVSDYLKRAKVSVCPVRLKIGVQTKILEALSWGTPVVTTSAGNSGVNGLSGRDLLVEDDPNCFASQVVELLRGKNWQRLSIGGRQLVAERFSWESSARELEKHIMDIQAEV